MNDFKVHHDLFLRITSAIAFLSKAEVPTTYHPSSHFSIYSPHYRNKYVNTIATPTSYMFQIMSSLHILIGRS